MAVTMYGEGVDVVGGDAQDEDSDDDSEDTGALRTLAKVRAAIEGASLPRAPPSGGDPSHW